ncbi:MAG: amino acid adenylation domain-containing protein [Methanobrevibacter sp.]|nr:amino acid adenylation domain-containing protein [Methanobrevibacter sp.]
MEKLNKYNNCLTNVPNVIESTFNQIILNFDREVDESFFISAMMIYLSRINQSEGIIFKIYRNNYEIPLKLDYNENISVNSLLLEVDDLISNIQVKEHVFDNELLHAYSFFNKKINDEFVPHEKSILNCLFDGKSIEFVYNDSIFSQIQMEFLIDSIKDIIKRMDENQDTLLKDLNIVSDNEMEILKRFSKTDTMDFDKNETIMDYIHKNALKSPDQIAISDTITNVTYGEFDKYINALSAILHNLGVEKGECVGVLLPRIPMYIVSCMGITRNASVFVPLDLTYPKDRIDYIIEESGMNYIISSKTVDYASQFEDKNILYIEELDWGTDEVSPNNVVASDLAAIYFTSGSTGNPKGVKVSHYTFLLEALYSSKYLTSGSDIACYVNLTFSFSVVSYSAFVKGANCIIINEYLKENVPKLIEFLQVTPLDALILPTILGATILERTEIKTKNMIIAGERLKEATPTILSRKTDLINCYGSTEALVMAYQDVKKASQLDEIPVGYPAGNTWIYILDKNNMPLPIGVPGEIVASSLKLALGYHNNEAQTNETFVENPFSDCWENKRMLHTRDQGYLTFDGELVVKGRIDRQIKLRGLRIEPGEIENVVLNYSPSITNVVVELRNDNLVCYYISDGEIDEDDLNEFIKGKVTQYMVPSFYMKMDDFPLNLNGKVDVKALPTPEFAIEEIVEPKTDIEIKLFEIISNILKTDKFGITTDLVRLGLNSLSSIKIAYEIASNWGVQLSIKELNDAKDIQNLASLIDAPSELTEVVHEKQELYPLSQNQLGVYFESIKHPDKLIYNTTSAVDLGAGIDVEKLKSSIVKLVDKYTYLKSILFEENGKTYLNRQDDEPVNVDVFESLATDEIKNSFARPFDLFKGPLYRFEIYHTVDKTILLMDVHHILFDGTSVNLFINELLDEYDDINDAEEVSSGFDFILDEKELEGSEKYLKAKEFFEDRLADIENVTSINPDKAGEKELGSLKEVSVQINKENIFEFSKVNGITPNSLFLASSLLTLSKFSYTKDMLLTTISNGRINPKYFKTLAMIVRSLPIAMTIDTNQSVLDYINSVNETFVDTIDNESYPFTKIFEEHNFIPEIYYAYQVGLFDEKILKNGNKVNVEPLELDYPKFNICIYVEEDLENINLIIRYNDQLYSHELMESLVEGINLVLNKFMNSLTENASDISLLTSFEENEITKKEDELTLNINEPLLKDKFEYIASKKPDEIAVYANDANLTFEELNEKANVFANSLIDRGFKTNDKVILKLKRTSKLMIALIGSLKAGVSFIPIDPKYPQERITHIQEDSGCKMIISDSPLTGEVGIDNLLDGSNTENPKLDLKNDDIAFLIYTSGSTGLPKGVMIKQDSITNYIKPTPENSPINAIANDVSKMLSITTASFIAFLREAFASIMNGVPMVLADEEASMNPIRLANLIKEHGIDGMSATPSRLQQYLTIDDFKRVLNDIKVITIGGEKFIESLYPTLVKYTNADIYNSYGPTEVTIASHAKLMKDNSVSEGKPIHNTIDSIVDLDNNPLPDHIIGNIAIGGVGVSAGYWNKPELTEKVFYTRNGIPYYNTGDLGYKRDDGELVVVGRADSQIKLRGLRIETGEIENAILKNSQIDLVFVNVQVINDTEYLCAYYVADSEIDTNKLKEDISQELTDYMIPTFFIQLDELPLNPNGKLDRKKLPLPSIDDEITEVVEASNELEQIVLDMCRDIISKDDFGVTTNLFNIGFTSLTVIQLLARISEELKVDVSIMDMMKSKNVLEIVELIDAADMVSETEEAELMEYYPLTHNQLGVYFDCIKNPDKIGYNLPKIIRFDKGVDSARLRKSIIDAIDLHSYLKMELVQKDGQILQKRNDELDISDLVTITTQDVEVTQEDIDAFIRPFSLYDELLFRFEIIETPSEVVLLNDFHHLILDGTSANLFFRDITLFYDGKTDEIPEETVDAFEYSLIEKDLENSNKYKQAESFFDRQISDFDESTVVTPDLESNDEGVLCTNELSLNASEVHGFCRKEGITENNLFLSATILALSKFSFSRDLLISTVSTGRTNPKYRNTIGMLVKTLPFACHIKSEKSVKDLIEDVNENWLNTLNYEFYPYTKIANKYDLTPEFLYIYQGEIIEDLNMNGKTYERERIDYDSLRFKISFNVLEENGELKLINQYDNSLYSSHMIDLFNEAVKTIIEKFMSCEISETMVKDIGLVEEPELEEFDYSFNPFLNEVFHETVEKNKDKLALIAEDGEFTYDELNRKANRIANALIKKGVKPGDKVLFKLKRDSNLTASMWGIIKAGAAFIPVDPEYPEERINYIYGDSEADYIISDFSDNNTLNVFDLLKEENEANPVVKFDPDNLAFMIYTSGSTGNPKGVMLTHRNITNYLLLKPENNYITDVVTNRKRVLGIQTVTFDISVCDVLVPLTHGLTYVFASDVEAKDVLALAKLIKRTKVDAMAGTPSRLFQYLDLDEMKEAFKNLKSVSLGGEPFKPQLFTRIKSINPDVNLYNGYGPSETTIHTNHKLLTSADNITTGKPNYNVIMDVRDIDGNLVPDGVMGEIYIGGLGVGKGYLNKEKRTKESFLKINGINYYKSGDYGTVDPEGEFVIHGRLDNQIKLNGLRIELGEVEQSILKFGKIKEVVCAIKKINENDHLCAYYTSDEEIDKDELKDFISKTLTKYMVPSVFVQLNELPWTLNGKIEVKKLPIPEITNEYVKPSNNVEAFFASAFEEILGLNKVGVTDNFFDIGGTSLLVTKLTISALNEGYEVQYADIFNYPTPRDLAQFISGEGIVESEESQYDYSRIDELLSQNTMNNFLNGDLRDLGNVLLTGASGFLGIHILKELIENEEGIIYCLQRAGKTITAEDRLKSLLFYYFDENYEDIFGKKIIVVEGDITNIEDFKKLENYPIDTIINAAANVKHFAEGSQIEDVNIFGVKNGLEFAKTVGACYVQVSTTSTAGESVNNFPPKDTVFDEQTLYVGQALDNKYLSSKFAAERLVLEHVVEGGDGKIVRVGNLMARESDAEFQINFESNGFINRIKAYVTLHAMPFELLVAQTEFSPIDVVAKSIVTLSKTPKLNTVFNSYNNHYISYADVLHVLKSQGYEMAKVEMDEFNALLDNARKDESKQEGISGLVTQVGMGKSKNRSIVDVSNTFTINILNHFDVYWPLTTYDYLNNFINYLQSMGFLE